MALALKQFAIRRVPHDASPDLRQRAEMNLEGDFNGVAIEVTVTIPWPDGWRAVGDELDGPSDRPLSLAPEPVTTSQRSPAQF